MAADTNNNRIGILGGTFNPVHRGHLALAKGAIKAFSLRKVLFTPSAKPPHKTPQTVVSVKHRMAMLQLAIKDNPRFEICDIETRRAGPSYTIDTITQLKRMNPSAKYFFIIGSDSLQELHMWKEIKRLLALCTFVTFGRPGATTSRTTDLHLDSRWKRRLLKNFIKGRMPDISSSNIRQRVAQGKSIRYLVSDKVAEYILKKKLYNKNKEKRHKSI